MQAYIRCIIYHVHRPGKRSICAYLVDNYMYMTHVYAWPMDVYIEFIMCICFFKIDFICICVLPACIFAYHVHALPVEARRGCHIL